MPEMPLTGSVAEAIGCVPEGLLETVADAAATAEILGVARHIPLPTNVLVEVNLCGRTGHSLCLPITESDGSLGLLLADQSSSPLAGMVDAGGRGRLIRSVAGSSEVRAFLHPLWLEWDIETAMTKGPSLYLSYEQPEGEAWLLGWLSRDRGTLTPGLQTIDIGNDLERFLRSVPDGGHVQAVGSMLSRANPSLRLVLSRMPADQAVKYLLQCGLIIGSTQRSHLAYLQAQSREVGLHIDFTENGPSLTGLDVIARAGALHDPIVERLLGRFLSDERRAPALDSLTRWAGTFAMGGVRVALGLSHLKISLGEAGEATLKVYLSVLRVLAGDRVFAGAPG